MPSPAWSRQVSPLMEISPKVPHVLYLPNTVSSGSARKVLRSTILIAAPWSAARRVRQGREEVRPNRYALECRALHRDGGRDLRIRRLERRVRGDGGLRGSLLCSSSRRLLGR